MILKFKHILLFFLFYELSFSQEKKILLLDSDNNNPIPFSSIKFVGLNHGTYTNENWKTIKTFNGKEEYAFNFYLITD
jgi:hypothetical protein